MTRYFVVAAVVVLVGIIAFVWRAPLGERLVYATVRPHFEDVRIGGSQARIYYPDGFRRVAAGQPAILFLHGNTRSHDSYLGQETLKRINRGRSLVALIDGQDFAAPPFQSRASGWGNPIYKDRYLALYRYLKANRGVTGDIDLIGESMGGLAMGRFIVNRDLPVRRAYGLGPVPFIAEIFVNGGDLRKRPIRNAFGMASDGGDDNALLVAAHDADWTSDLRPGMRLPPLWIVAGNGDVVFQRQFGGAEAYTRLCRQYRQAGGVCSYREVQNASHADGAMTPMILDEIERNR